MTTPIRALFIEDSERDELLEVRELEKAGFEVACERVDTPEGVKNALRETQWDVILADYTMPLFSGSDALALYNEFQLDTPFIMVSGTIGEERAVAAMKEGAKDYVSKNNLQRLVPVVQRELNEAKARISHKKMQTAFQEHQEQLRLFVEYTPAPVAMMDSNMCYLVVSKRWQMDYGLEDPNIIGRSHYDIFPEIPERWKEIYRRCLAGAIEKCEAEPFPRADGSIDWVRWEIHPWRKSNDEIGGIIIFSELITERKKEQEALKQAKEEAEIANRKKSEFLAMISHELRTPLNAVIGFSEMLVNGMGGRSLNEKEQRYLHNILISGNHLLELINELLDVSKVEANRMELSLEQVELKPLLEHSRMTVEELAKKKNVQLVFDIQPEIGSIQADPLRLKQILFNLLSNAIKFNHEGGRVTIKMFPEEQWLVCAIQDTGIGIPKDKWSELFQPFSQLDTSYARREEGTGLGLALTKHLVELHGGTITVESEVDIGSTFTFRLPIH